MLKKSFFLIFIFCFVELSFAEKFNMTRDEINAKCAELLQVEEDEIEKVHKMTYVTTDDSRLKCFIRCFMTGMNVMNTDGDFTIEDADPSLQNREYFDKCKHVTGDGSCNKAVNFQNCVWDEVNKKKNK